MYMGIVGCSDIVDRMTTVILALIGWSMKGHLIWKV